MYQKRIDDNQTVMSDLVKDVQNQDDRKGELFQMILELRKEVESLKNKK